MYPICYNKRKFIFILYFCFMSNFYLTFSKPTHKIEITNNFNLSVFNYQKNKIRFEIEMKVSGYIGFGFGPTMQDTDMIITQLNKFKNIFSIF